MYLSVYEAYLASGRHLQWARNNNVSLSRINQMNLLVAVSRLSLSIVILKRDAIPFEWGAVLLE